MVSSRAKCHSFLAVIVLCLALPGVRAQSTEPVRYTLSFPAPHTHYVEVEASVPSGGKPEIEMFMAAWTPGSYLIREFARNVEGLTAHTTGGKPLAARKTSKNRWRISTGASPRITVNYRVYSREMSVQANWVESDFAMLNGAPTFLTLVDPAGRPHEVTLKLPPAWETSMTGLPAASPDAPHRYVAADFDTLLDSPIVAGNPAVYEFEVDGKKHYLVNIGEGGMWDGAAAARDVEKIVRETRRMWGPLPYEKYVFLNMIVEASGGLEHKNSTLLMTSRWAYRKRRPETSMQTYPGWLSLVAHEYFHTWNVKRLRPVELGPFDYENEVYTRSLWIAEGITSYYAPLIVHRAGLSEQSQYLDALSRNIERLQTTPGRLVQPLEDASFDAWIKFYRVNENSPNTSISYYTKGAVIGFLLDAKVREATKGAKSLDDVMRVAYQRYSGERGFQAGEFRAAASEVAGKDLGPWFQEALESTRELEYGEALDWFGLRWKPVDARSAQPKPSSGLVTTIDRNRLVVKEVRRGTAGFAAGFNVDDELVAVNGYRVPPEDWPARLEQYKPGEKISVLIARRNRLMPLEVTLEAEAAASWRLETRPDARADERKRLKDWLLR